VTEINGRYIVTVDTINGPNLRSRSNVYGIGLVSGLHTVRVFGYVVGSTFFNTSCMTVNLTITLSSIPLEQQPLVSQVLHIIEA
jgi:hypothetical protein